MKARRTIIAVSGALLTLGIAGLLDLQNGPAQQVAMSRGDRIDVVEQAAGCTRSSMIAACADDNRGMPQTRQATMLQVFERPSETILVKVRIGD